MSRCAAIRCDGCKTEVVARDLPEGWLSLTVRRVGPSTFDGRCSSRTTERELFPSCAGRVIDAIGGEP